MILNFIMGFVSGIAFTLLILIAMAWDSMQEKKRKNSSTFDWDKGEYNEGTEDPENKKKI